MKIRNRLLRAGFGLAALGLALTGTACNGLETSHSPDAPSAQLAPLKPRLDSDMANLVAAIVVPTQMESFKTIAMGSGGHPLFRGGQARGAVSWRKCQQGRHLRPILSSVANPGGRCEQFALEPRPLLGDDVDRAVPPIE